MLYHVDAICKGRSQIGHVVPWSSVSAKARIEANQAVAAQMAAIVDLLNSRPHATPLLPDTLADPAAAVELLRPFGQPGQRPSPSRIAAVTALRSALIDIVGDEDNAGPARGWAELTKRAAPIRLRQLFSESQTELEQVSGDPVVGSITLAVAELVRAGWLSRIRICANGLCRHAFYDTTRSRTQRWHSYEICGNRNNVAAYRARKKGVGGAHRARR